MGTAAAAASVIREAEVRRRMDDLQQEEANAAMRRRNRVMRCPACGRSVRKRKRQQADGTITVTPVWHRDPSGVRKWCTGSPNQGAGRTR